MVKDGREPPQACRRRVRARLSQPLALAIATIGLSGFVACSDGPPAQPELLQTARDIVNRPTGTFQEEARQVLLIDSLIEAAGRDPEATAELALLRLRAIERVIADTAARSHNPYANIAGRPSPPEAIRAWLEAHGDEIAYSEPAGEWLVPADVFWRVHDRHRRAEYSDAIAWAAASAGLPGECEGFAGCYVDGLLRTYGRYLETHPDGLYTEEALTQVTTLLQEIGEAESGREICGNGRDSDGVTTDQLQRIRRLLEPLPPAAGAGRTAAEQALSSLEQRCGKPNP